MSAYSEPERPMADHGIGHGAVVETSQPIPSKIDDLLGHIGRATGSWPTQAGPATWRATCPCCETDDSLLVVNVDDVPLVTCQHGCSDSEVQGRLRPWPALQPLPSLAPSVPHLSADMLPAPLATYCADVCDRSGLPLEAVAAPLIVTLGAAVGRRVGLKPDRKSDFLVVGNLWGAVIANPGMMKTDAIGAATLPLRRCEDRARQEDAGREAAAAPRRQVIEAEIDGIRAEIKRLARAGKPVDGPAARLTAKQGELAALQVRPTRYTTSDATVEKIGLILSDNPTGLLLLRDELTGWLHGLDRAGRESERAFYLEAWNGLGGFNVDRVGRGSLHIPGLALSLLGSLQPGPLAKLVEDATSGRAGADGLLQRFQCVVVVDELSEWQPAEHWPDKGARSAVCDLFDRLVTLDPSMLGAQSGDLDPIPYLVLDREAQEVRDTWRREHEARMRGEDLQASPAYCSAVAKQRSLQAKLALVFDLVSRLTDCRPMSGPVGAEAARLACDWTAFLEQHQARIYAIETCASAGAAHALASKVQLGAVVDGEPIRDITRHGWRGLRTGDDVDLAVDQLEVLGWCRAEVTATGGRPSRRLRINPRARGAA